MFDHFWDTVETIEPGLGFGMYSITHIVQLILAISFFIIMSIIYKKADKDTRRKIELVFVVLLWLDEAIKHISLLTHGTWLVDYLPLHLCSINIFMITIFYFTRNKLIGNFIYCLCIPAAIVALLFPNWAQLPLVNCMSLHSYTVHVLLACYPIMLTYGKEIIKNYKNLPKLVLMLAILSIPIELVNLAWGTNFMFLTEAPKGTPLEWAEILTGSHLVGFAVLIPIILACMYIPYKKVED